MIEGNLGTGATFSRRRLLQTASASVAVYSLSRAAPGSSAEVAVPGQAESVRVGVSGDLMRLAIEQPRQLRPTIRALREAGVAVVRFPVNWSQVQPDRFSFDWRAVDRIYGCLSWHGLDALPVIFNWPTSWLSRSGGAFTGSRVSTARADESDGLASFACSLVDHLSRIDSQVSGLEVLLSRNESFEPGTASSFESPVNAVAQNLSERFAEIFAGAPIIAGGVVAGTRVGGKELSLDGFDQQVQLGLQIPPQLIAGDPLGLQAKIPTERQVSMTIGLPRQVVGSPNRAIEAIHRSSNAARCEAVYIAPLRQDLGSAVDNGTNGVPVVSGKDEVKPWLLGVGA